MFLALLLPALSLAQYVVPLPPGPYGVSIQDALITDYAQHDPFLNLTYRRIPVSIISPTGSSAKCEPVLQPYMPNVSATIFEEGFYGQYGLPLNGTFSQTVLTLCKPTALNHTTPVALFAPGAGSSRYFYNAMGAAIVAQSGYTIITYEVPGLPLVTEFPDGSLEYESNDNVTNDELFAILAQYSSIILNAVFNNTGRTRERMAGITISPQLPTHLGNVTDAAIIGHSQGGGGATVALLADSRLSGAINMDGIVNTTNMGVNACTDSNTTLRCIKSTTTKPYMLLEHDGFNQSVVPGWVDLWADVLRGSKWQIQLNGSEHATYGDYPYLLDLYGIRQELFP